MENVLFVIPGKSGSSRTLPQVLQQDLPVFPQVHAGSPPREMVAAHDESSPYLQPGHGKCEH